VNLRDFRQSSILASERSGLLTQIAANGKCFAVRADEKLTAFLELEICDSIRQNATEDCGGQRFDANPAIPPVPMIHD
jgi:hypothetical protein